MEPKEAVDLINSMGFKPGWTVGARTWQERHQSSIILTVNFPAPDSSFPPEYKIPVEGGVHGEYALLVGDCRTWDDLMRKVLTLMIEIETHEWREFLRLGAEHDHYAPFHPHTDAGMLRWAKLANRHAKRTEAEHLLSFDLQFGRI